MHDELLREEVVSTLVQEEEAVLSEEVAEALVNQILSTELKTLLTERVALESVTSRVQGELINFTLEEVLVQAEELLSVSNGILDELVSSIVAQEAGYELQLERDAEVILN